MLPVTMGWTTQDYFLPPLFMPFTLSCLGFFDFLSFFWLLFPLPMAFLPVQKSV